jgi:hypothetical protein
LQALQSNNSIEEFLHKCLMKNSPSLQQIEYAYSLNQNKSSNPIGKTPWFNYFMEFIQKGSCTFYF